MCTVCMHIFKLCVRVHRGVWVCFPLFELVCTVAILLHSHSRASVKWLELMMLLKCLWAASPVERAVMPSVLQFVSVPLLLWTFGQYHILFYIPGMGTHLAKFHCCSASGCCSSYLVFLGVQVVLGGVYQGLLFLLLALSFLGYEKGFGLRCSLKCYIFNGVFICKCIVLRSVAIFHMNSRQCQESQIQTLSRFPFTHVAHNRGLSMSECSHLLEILYYNFWLGEGWHLDRACRTWCRVHGNHLAWL